MRSLVCGLVRIWRLSCCFSHSSEVLEPLRGDRLRSLTGVVVGAGETGVGVWMTSGSVPGFAPARACAFFRRPAYCGVSQFSISERKTEEIGRRRAVDCAKWEMVEY